MFTPDELALLKRYVPLIDVELRRIGVSQADQDWIHAGSDRRPTETMLAMLSSNVIDRARSGSGWPGRSLRPAPSA